MKNGSHVGSLFFLLAVSSSVLAQASWVPVNDSRLELTLCGTNLGTSGIRNSRSQKVCIGKVRDSDQGVVVVVNPNKPPQYLAIVERELTREVGEQEFGIREWHLKLRIMDQSTLQSIGSGETTATMVQSWQYSEGFVRIEGEIPGESRFSASLVDANEENPDRE